MFLLMLQKEAKLKHSDMGVAVTGSTGAAAVGVGGTTVHNWSGIGTGEAKKEVVLNRVQGNQKAFSNWLNCRVIFIDEISMVSGRLFSLLSFIGCSVRQNFSKPFGGVRVVVCGDFHQLPPVDKHEAERTFAFQTPEWAQLFPSPLNCVILRASMRQQEDPKFFGILSKIRAGDTSCVDDLNEHCCRKLPTVDGVIPTRLYCLNVAVDAVNKAGILGSANCHLISFLCDKAELEKIEGQSKKFYSCDWLREDGKFVKLSKTEPHPLFKHMSLNEEVVLKSLLKKIVLLFSNVFKNHSVAAVGAQCVLLSNVSTQRGLVNGSRGVVIAYAPPESDPPKETQAWFRKNGPLVPVVRFAAGPMAVLPRELCCQSGNESASRVQIPLALCFAITVHKSQGLTLDKVATDLVRLKKKAKTPSFHFPKKGEAFEEGQVYTALSRVRSLQALELVRPLTAKSVLTSAAVQKFYASLTRR